MQMNSHVATVEFWVSDVLSTAVVAPQPGDATPHIMIPDELKVTSDAKLAEMLSDRYCGAAGMAVDNVTESGSGCGGGGEGGGGLGGRGGGGGLAQAGRAPSSG